MALVGSFAPLIQMCFLACYLAFLLRRPPLTQFLVVTASGIVLGWAFRAVHLGPVISGLGLAAALWAAVAPFFRKHPMHPAIGLLVLYPTVATSGLLALAQHQQVVLDRYLLAGDGSFGIQPGFTAAAFLLTHPRILAICEFAYFGLPVAMACLLHTSSARFMVRLCLLLAVTGILGYSLFPAVGAGIVLPGEFPFHPPMTNASTGSAITAAPENPRNLMPSLHTAWGIALLLAAWPLGVRWRVAYGLYLIPMLMYAQAMHYFCDLLVAVPWAAGTYWSLEKAWGRAALCGSMAAVWMLLIRFGLPLLYLSPVVPWLLLMLTVLATGLTAFGR